MKKQMSEQMQKLAERYEKATGKKFNQTTNMDRFRAMSVVQLASVFQETGCPPSKLNKLCDEEDCTQCWVKWFKEPAEGDKT